MLTIGFMHCQFANQRMSNLGCEEDDSYFAVISFIKQGTQEKVLEFIGDQCVQVSSQLRSKVGGLLNLGAFCGRYCDYLYGILVEDADYLAATFPFATPATKPSKGKGKGGKRPAKPSVANVHYVEAAILMQKAIAALHNSTSAWHDGFHQIR